MFSHVPALVSHTLGGSHCSRRPPALDGLQQPFNVGVTLAGHPWNSLDAICGLLRESHRRLNVLRPDWTAKASLARGTHFSTGGLRSQYGDADDQHCECSARRGSADPTIVGKLWCGTLVKCPAIINSRSPKCTDFYHLRSPSLRHKLKCQLRLRIDLRGMEEISLTKDDVWQADGNYTIKVVKGIVYLKPMTGPEPMQGYRKNQSFYVRLGDRLRSLEDYTISKPKT
ncbi:hypothetical protein PSV08DRAFT_373750 [Bipolaris maydis]|uniref:uncharacterized protein n=1 Tax=Cochliobolus heterostrophus TaxID=5016 RepID=UPI0024DA3900|nr:hypothetical protein PSV08DRAFT_373524 [Bipolaris maydis]KAJ6267672.1 hypothetical protein PSV08DRAFT_373750 [Bipolaris maydis]